MMMIRRKELMPEGESIYEVYKQMTYLVRKIYSFYEAVSDFPVGLLLVILIRQLNFQIYLTLAQSIFEEPCKSIKFCKKRMIWDAQAGMLPPMYRDIWLKNYATHTVHH